MAPESVAVVGASPTGRHGRPMVENFATMGFAGTVYAVNPRYDEVLGVPCYPSLRELPATPDAVMIGVNKERAEVVLEDAAALGAGGAVLTAIGYAESGATGQRDQARITALARAADMALIGPNCMGLVNFSASSALYLDPVEPYTAGRVSLISNSGSVAVALTNNSRGVRWSHVVSSGNEAVVGSADLLAYAVDDPATSIVAAFIETIRDPERFFAECDRAHAAGKPVVVLKSGRSERSQAAAQAHSGALAVPDRLLDALFRRHHVIRVASMEALLNTVTLLGAGRLPAGDGLVVVSESGGEVGLILDEVNGLDLRFPALGPDTIARVSDYVPPAVMARNPIDLWALADAEHSYPKLLTEIVADPEVATLAAVVQTDSGPTIPGDALAQGTAAATAAAASTHKPVALIAPLDGATDPELVQVLASAGVALLSGFGQALRAIELVTRHARPARTAAVPADVDEHAVRRRFAALDDQPAAGQRALDLLAAAGIPTVRSAEVLTADEAVTAAIAIGYPVAVKLGDPAVLHKTEVGGVILGVGDEQAVRSAVARIRSMPAGAGGPIVIQQQITGGLELILGIQHQAGLGTFVLAGSGGIWTEVLEDVAFRPAGLRTGEAREMLGELRVSRILRGARGTAPLDIDSVADAVARIDALAGILGPQLTSLDLNPLVALPHGVVALDALVVPIAKEST